MSAPASRPVHPCVVNINDATRSAEFSTWAFITGRSSELPNLVSASGTSVSVYSVDTKRATLRLEYSFGNLAGSVIYLATLRSGSATECDSLLLAFAGHPRLTVLKVTDAILRAYSLIDLTLALTEACHGCTSVLEQDSVITCLNNTSGSAIVSAILGGGVSVVVFTITYLKNNNGWVASDPYILPLWRLCDSLPHRARETSSGNVVNPTQYNSAPSTSIATGFGDIVSACFLSGYLEPVLVLLHTDPGGLIWCGRLGRVTGGAVPIYVTALSISVSHKRTALLWCREVASDSFQVTSLGSKPGCLVISSNSLTVLEIGGRIQQAIAVNGFARSTCPSSMMCYLHSNPMVKLSIHLHGAKFCWISESVAIVVLRMGQIYVLQLISDKWLLLALGNSIGTAGEIATLSSIPIDATFSVGIARKILDCERDDMSFGLVFAGSRLGDSFLLGFAMEVAHTSLNNDTLTTFLSCNNNNNNTEKPNSMSTKGESMDTGTNNTLHHNIEIVLSEEEAALYSSLKDSKSPDIIPPSDEESEDNGRITINRIAKRQRKAKITIFRTITTLDVLLQLGPLGSPCEGPLAQAPKFLTEKESFSSVVSTDTIHGAFAHIFPCGYASSGGIALVTAPGRDDRLIVAEEDCLNVKQLFSLPMAGLLFLSLASETGGGMRVLRRTSLVESECHKLDEVDLQHWYRCNDHPSEQLRMVDILTNSTLLGAADFTECCFVLLVKLHGSEMSYIFLVMREYGNALQLEKYHILAQNGDELRSCSPFLLHKIHDQPVLVFACLWSSGDVTVATLSANFDLSLQFLHQRLDSRPQTMDDEDEDITLKNFYADSRVTAIDVFEANSTTFSKSFEKSFEASKSDEFIQQCRMPGDTTETSNSFSFLSISKKYQLDSDKEDEELYGSIDMSCNKSTEDFSFHPPSSVDEPIKSQIFLGLARQSGDVEVYSIHGNCLEQCWYTAGASLGLSHLKHTTLNEHIRLPRLHMDRINEIRFFYCGETSKDDCSAIQELCFAVETNQLDVYLYKQTIASIGKRCPEFRRIPTRSVYRPSQEQERHNAKLVRKGVISKEVVTVNDTDNFFKYSSLFRFSGISGQDGLFAATARPIWVVSERGRPTCVVHRARHAAPAGCKKQPLSGFCTGLFGTGTFITLHERVGRVGSQRLTFFRGMSTLSASLGLLPGSGYCVEKIPLGVTVRRVQFIDDKSISSGDHPLYAMLVSRELEVDQSALNFDGLSNEERKRLQDERESAKIQRQVEADLGGFDMESEWVEEIEREECFRVDTSLGGAPPIRQSAYSLWILDSANKWMVVDSFELGEHEHGMDLKVMTLTDFHEEPGSGSSIVLDDGERPEKQFIVVGTGIVNQDGEDVSAKGRTLLFEIKRSIQKTRLSLSQVAELSLCHEKEVFHGPVSTLACLFSEGKNRLVIGAGSDVNIEQWGNGKLTQVGFFRATMQILDVTLFKNFFLLSDAYDSLYFLVWRESDKSLTLLAKDYDPIPVHAVGIMSRGSAVTFLCHDDRQNLQFFQYAPGEAAARGGNKLVCRADYHLGSQTTAFMSHYCRPSLLIHSATPRSTLSALKQQDIFFGRQEEDNRLGVHFGTADGGIASVVPLNEPVYWRLLALQSVIRNALENDCALSRRAWRLYRRTTRRGGCRSNDRKKGVIDGDLVLQYTDLPRTEQEDIASAIGSTVSLILDNLLELHCSSMIL